MRFIYKRERCASDMRDIRGMNKRNTPGFVPNGISILTKDGAAHKFAVNKRDDSLAFLQKPRTDRKAGKRNGEQ